MNLVPFAQVTCRGGHGEERRDVTWPLRWQTSGLLVGPGSYDLVPGAVTREFIVGREWQANRLFWELPSVSGDVSW